MASTLLSTFYAEVIDPPEKYTRASANYSSPPMIYLSTYRMQLMYLLSSSLELIVDEIIPPAFLKKQLETLPTESKGIEEIKKDNKNYLSVPLHAENVLRKWVGNKNTAVEDVKKKINNFLIEYITSGDKAEACKCIKDLKVPFFHHDTVKHALTLVMDRGLAEDPF